MRFFGPWLRRYETFRARQVPAEADRFNPYRGRYTELVKPDQRWLEVVSAFIGYEPEVDFLREKPRLQ